MQVRGIVAEVFSARGRGGVWWKGAFSSLVEKDFPPTDCGGELENKNNNNGTSARVAAGWLAGGPGGQLVEASRLVVAAAGKDVMKVFPCFFFVCRK